MNSITEFAELNGLNTKRVQQLVYYHKIPHFKEKRVYSINGFPQNVNVSVLPPESEKVLLEIEKRNANPKHEIMSHFEKYLVNMHSRLKGKATNEQIITAAIKVFRGRNDLDREEG